MEPLLGVSPCPNAAPMCVSAGSSAIACLWRRPNRCMPCTSIPRASRAGKTWRQERTHYAETDITRHLYLLPGDVQQRHHHQAPEYLPAAAGRTAGGRGTRDRTSNENLAPAG